MSAKKNRKVVKHLDRNVVKHIMVSFEQLKADFKRIYIMNFGAEGWNEAVKENSLPQCLGYTTADYITEEEAKKIV